MLYQDDDEERSGLEQAGRARQHQFSGRRWRWTGSRAPRARRPTAGKRVPPVIFKISSHAHSGGAVWDRVNYVARDGELAVEGPNRERIEDLVEIEQIAAAWSDGAEDHKRRVLAMSAIVSFPAGVDQEKATEAARQFFQAAFAENHDYIFAPHTDTGNFHVHVVVQAAGHDGKQLRIRRQDLQGLKELLAEKAGEQGIELDATPRKARGLEAKRGPSREIEGIHRRGAEPSEARHAALKSRTARAALAEEQAARAASPGAGPGQALTYARASAKVAINLSELEGDSKKVDAIQAAAALGAVGLELAQHGREQAAEIEEAREIIWRSQRVIHENIQGIQGGEAKREAIQANRRLSRDLAAYRQERQQRTAQERQAPAAREQATDRGKDDGWER